MLDSDANNPDSQLFVEFYTSTTKPYDGVPFVRIMAPGDKTNIFDQPVRDFHKERFPRQWLHFKMQGDNSEAIGTPLAEWNKDAPDDFSDMQMAELQIIKFQTVEQLATASDSQVQKVGMGATGLREKARLWLINRNKSQQTKQLEETQRQVADLQQQLMALLASNIATSGSRIIESEERS